MSWEDFFIFIFMLLILLLHATTTTTTITMMMRMMHHKSEGITTLIHIWQKDKLPAVVWLGLLLMQQCIELNAVELLFAVQGMLSIGIINGQCVRRRCRVVHGRWMRIGRAMPWLYDNYTEPAHKRDIIYTYVCTFGLPVHLVHPRPPYLRILHCMNRQFWISYWCAARKLDLWS